MQTRYLVLIITVSVLFLVGVLGWVFLFNNKSPVENQPSGFGTSPSTNYTQTVTVSGGEEPVSPTETAIDPKAAHETVFASLGATLLTFTSVNSSSGPLGEIYALYSTELSAGTPVQIAQQDLDGEEGSEAIVYMQVQEYCGSGGCQLEVYRKVTNVWTSILSTLAYEWVGVMSTKTQGFSDLLISVKGDPGYMTRIVKYVWNGTVYQEASIVAIWDGEKFDLLP